MTAQSPSPLKCPTCDGGMIVTRRASSQARPEHEKQSLECEKCGFATTRTVDEAGRPARA